MPRAICLLSVLLAVAVAAPAAAAEPETVGLVDRSQGRWHLVDGEGDIASFFYGNPGDVPIVGDWDCDGVATPGMFRPSDGYVYLSNANRAQVADVAFYFGDPADVPLAGDFDGDGCDTVSVYRPATGMVYVVNRLGSADQGLGAADLAYPFGDPSDAPFTGDFDGDGVDTVGLHRRSTGLVYLRQSHGAGAADLAYVFGNGGDRLVAGDWDGVGGATPALFRPADATFYFANSHAGAAGGELRLGLAGMAPVAGSFGDLVHDPAVPAVTPGLAALTLASVNEARAAHGVAALRPDAAISGLAEERAWQLYALGYLAHDLPGGFLVDQLRSAGVALHRVGENLAAGGDPAYVVGAWMGSAAHRPNLLNGQFDRAGVGVADGPAGRYYVYVAVG